MRAPASITSLAVLLFAVAQPASARQREVAACWRELGAGAAGQLVRDCREAGPKTPALCRPDVPCAALRELIAEGCRMPGAEAKAACDDVEDPDDEEDGEE